MEQLDPVRADRLRAAPLTYERSGTPPAGFGRFSRPATRLARVGGPVTGLVQRTMTRRYLAGPDLLAGAA